MDSDSQDGVSQWKSDLQTCLDEVVCHGQFAVSMPVVPPLLQPKLEIDEFGAKGERLPLPLTTRVAQALIESPVTEKAPFGRGMDTVLDDTVREAWQIDANKVKFHNRVGEVSSSPFSWKTFVQSTTLSLCQHLGLSPSQLASVEAHLYKVLLYETGGHFAKHRDTEKEPGMFGTMIIQLPSQYQGGALVIQHDGVTKTFNVSKQAQDGFFATAFFADCEHELKPITEGYRIVLAYNLVLKQQQQPQQSAQQSSSSSLPSAAALTRDLVKLKELGWKSNSICHGYILKHKYTPTNLSFPNLKGKDRSVVDLLCKAQDEHGNPLFCVSLALLTRHQSGTAEFDYDSYKRRRYNDNSSAEDKKERQFFEEIYEDTTNVIGPNGVKLSDPRILNNDVIKKCLLMNSELGELFPDGKTPDEQDYEGYTGNAGPTLDYWYYRSALLICPLKNTLELAKALGETAAISIFVSYGDLLPVDAKNNFEEMLATSFKESMAGCASMDKASKYLPVLQKFGNVAAILDLLNLVPKEFLLALTDNISIVLIEKFQSTQTSNEKDALAHFVRRNIIPTLEMLTKDGPPIFSWRQPNARFEGSGGDLVVAFLRSDEREKTFQHFNDSSHARNWVNKYFGYAHNGTFSAKARVEGMTTVRVVKDRAAFDNKLALYEKNKTRLTRLQAVFGTSPAS